MIKEIIKDQMFLACRSSEATSADLPIVQDLLDTILAYQDQCLGMAANMIGQLKKMMVVNDQGQYIIIINPILLKTSSQRYDVKEGCLSLIGTRETTRYEKIKLEYYNEKFQKRIKTFQGLTAQIIQHEMDHFEGRII
jgi:peptide deformylase